MCASAKTSRCDGDTVGEHQIKKNNRANDVLDI